MSGKNLLLGGIAAATLAFSANAFAGGFVYPKEDCTTCGYTCGVYLGLSGGYAHTNWCDTEDVLKALGYTSVSIDDGAFGLRGFLGYDFNENFAVEIGYLWTNNNVDWKASYVDGADTVTVKDSIGHHAFDAVVKLRVMLDDGFAVYTKLGVAYMEACDAFMVRTPATFKKGDVSNTNVTFGAGFQYCISPNFIANADWQHYRGSDEGDCFLADLNFFSVGIAYKFAV